MDNFLRQNRIAVSVPKGVQRISADDARLAFDHIPALLDDLRPQFNTQLRLQAFSLPGRRLPALTQDQNLSPFIFSAPGIRHVQPDPRSASDLRVLLLNIEADKPLPTEVQAVLEKHATDVSLIPDFTVTLGWDNLTSDQVLEALLPSDIVRQEGVPGGFTIVGHIAHLNLLDVYLPFRFLVGHVILSKNASALRTVVNKLDSIDTEFRFFKMELLAGESDFIAHVSESDCTFSFDFRTVYWNSRLHGEHMRLIRQFRPNQVVADVMAGVGPFALPAAKRACWVLANDLNPSSYDSLLANSKANKVFLPHTPELDAEGRPRTNKFNAQLDGGVLAHCIDGREFVRQCIVDTWHKAFPGRPCLATDSSSAAATGEEQDERIRQFGKNEMKRRQKRNRDLHTARQAAKSGRTDISTSMTSLSITAKPEADVHRHAARKLIDHFVMNLPASALEFLDAYRGAYTHLAETLGPNGRQLVKAEIQRRQQSNETAQDDSEQVYPLVHVHCFSKEPFRPVADILDRANAALGIASDAPWRLQGRPITPPSQTLALTRKPPPPTPSYGKAAATDSTSTGAAVPSYLASHPDYAQFASMTSVKQMTDFLTAEWQHDETAKHSQDLHVHYVRDVAPNKQMYCLTFRLPPQVLWATT